MCEHCGLLVLPLDNGSYRNHCPRCLHSKHVDRLPGDRRSSCQGVMRPRGLRYHAKKGWQLVHVCLACGHIRANRIARDTVQPDDLERLLAPSAAGTRGDRRSKRWVDARSRAPPAGGRSPGAGHQPAWSQGKWLGGRS